MSKIKEIISDVQERLEEYGARPNFDKIAKEVGCPTMWVVNEFESMQQNDFGYNYDEEY